MIEIAPELLAFLRDEYDNCRDETLEDERETAIDRYNGRPYGDEEAGSSQVVARDTAEAVDYMTISILRTIVSGDRIVEFVHRDADAARQVTETIMHLLMDEQDGYLIWRELRTEKATRERESAATALAEKRIEADKGLATSLALLEAAIKGLVR